MTVKLTNIDLDEDLDSANEFIIARFKDIVRNRYSDKSLADLGKRPNFKEELFDYINSFTNEQAAKFLNQALDKNTALGKVFHTRRGLFEPTPTSFFYNSSIVARIQLKLVDIDFRLRSSLRK